MGTRVATKKVGAPLSEGTQAAGMLTAIGALSG